MFGSLGAGLLALLLFPVCETDKMTENIGFDLLMDRTHHNSSNLELLEQSLS